MNIAIVRSCPMPLFRKAVDIVATRFSGDELTAFVQQESADEVAAIAGISSTVTIPAGPITENTLVSANVAGKPFETVIVPLSTLGVTNMANVLEAAKRLSPGGTVLTVDLEGRLERLMTYTPPNFFERLLARLTIHREKRRHDRMPEAPLRTALVFRSCPFDQFDAAVKLLKQQHKEISLHCMVQDFARDKLLDNSPFDEFVPVPEKINYRLAGWKAVARLARHNYDAIFIPVNSRSGRGFDNLYDFAYLIRNRATIYIVTNTHEIFKLTSALQPGRFMYFWYMLKAVLYAMKNRKRYMS